MKKLFFIFMILSCTTLLAQVGIGTNKPNIHSNLHIDSNEGVKGLILPYITDAQQVVLVDSLGASESGLSFYNTDTKCVVTWNGSEFNKLCEQTKAEFTVSCDQVTVNGRYRQGYLMSSTEYISIPVNVTKEGPYNISASSGNGYYFNSGGYLTVGTHNLVIPAYGNPLETGEDVILLSNNLTNEQICSPLSVTVLSGNGEATITPASCQLITENAPSMVEGNSNSISLSVEIEVTLSGAVSFSTNTVNGVSFSGSFYFPTEGIHTLVINSNGTPENIGIFEYTLSLDGAREACTFEINVASSTVSPSNIGTITSQGVYVETIPTNSDHRIGVSNITFSGTGSFNIGVRYVSGGNGNPGLDFEGFSGNATGNTYNNVYFSTIVGTAPGEAGTYSYELYDVYTGASLGSPFSIVINPMVGSFNNPGQSCQHIFQTYNTATNLVLNDGEYWIKGPNASNDKYKTLCDMVSESEATAQGKTVGGYTLVWSYSEKTNLTTYNIGGNNVFSQYGDQVDWQSNNTSVAPRNLVTTEDGTMNYFDFRIPRAEAQRLTGGIVRVRYAQDPKNTDTDAYGADNYFETSGSVNWLGGGENFSGSMAGKYLGYDFLMTGDAGCCGKTITLGGQIITTGAAIFGNDGYGWHLDVNGNWAAKQVRVNNMWGFYGETDNDILPFGKCVNPTNSANGSSWSHPTCNGSVVTKTNPPAPETPQGRTVHPGINGDEGYVQQWWTK